MDDEDEIVRDPDGCVRINGQDCVARNEPCPPPGWCPAVTDAYMAFPIPRWRGEGQTMAMAWAFARILHREEDNELPCHEPRRRPSACH